MCSGCNDPHHVAATFDRRNLLTAGAGLAAAGLAGGTATAKGADAPMLGATKARAWAAIDKARFAPMEIQRRALGPNDVRMEILYSGICHSDIHMVRSEWMSARYPMVPGHEIIGRVTAVGVKVSKFRVGDIGGVGLHGR